MKFEQFRDNQWGISNDWAIRVTKIGRKYEVCIVEETDATIDNVEFGDDAIINMDLEKFIAMHSNNMFVDFANKGGSVLKASDTTPEVLYNIATKLGRVHLLTKSEAKKLLSCYELGTERYMGYDQDKTSGEVEYIKSVLDGTIEDEEDFGDESTTN